MVLLWRSDDGEQWHFKSVITSEKAFGYMWECPDLFRLDGHWFLSFSPQGVTREQDRRQNIYLSGYIPMKGGEDPCTAELDGDLTSMRPRPLRPGTAAAFCSVGPVWQTRTRSTPCPPPPRAGSICSPCPGK